MSTADRLRQIRVAIVGNSGTGKTCLAHLLATGKPAKSSRLTVGCNVFLKILQESAGETPAPQPSAADTYFVELWDIGAQDRYETLWPLFLKDINGLILVYDSSTSRGSASISRWAELVAKHATFIAPLAVEQAAGNLGALPIPFIIVANKADLKGSTYKGLRISKPLTSWATSVWQFLCRRREFAGIAKSISRTKSAAIASEVQANSVTASALLGDIDASVFDELFSECFSRRYQGGSLVRRPQKMAGETALSLKEGADVSPTNSWSTYRGQKKVSAPFRTVGSSVEYERRGAEIDLLGEWQDHGRIDDIM